MGRISNLLGAKPLNVMLYKSYSYLFSTCMLEKQKYFWKVMEKSWNLIPEYHPWKFIYYQSNMFVCVSTTLRLISTWINVMLYKSYSYLFSTCMLEKRKYFWKVMEKSWNLIPEYDPWKFIYYQSKMFVCVSTNSADAVDRLLISLIHIFSVLVCWKNGNISEKSWKNHGIWFRNTTHERSISDTSPFFPSSIDIQIKITWKSCLTWTLRIVNLEWADLKTHNYYMYYIT